jgi:3-O-methylgallate 3,4-dioxygenase
MARLVAAFGASHSIMLYCNLDDWCDHFVERDRTLPLYDDKGDRRSYDELLTKAGAKSDRLFSRSLMEKRYADTQKEMDRLGDEIAEAKLDVLIIVGDDQEELFDDNNIPALGIYCDDKIRNAPRDASWPESDWQETARQQRREDKQEHFYPCHKPLALHLTSGLCERGFDVAAVKKLSAKQFEGHAYSFIHRRIMAGRVVPIIPVFVNTYYPPNQVTPKRCVALGNHIADLIASFPQDLRVGILASGGLSHFVVDEELDLSVLDAIKRKDLEFLGNIDPKRLQAGSSEIRNWMVVAAAAQKLNLNMSRSSYIAGYRTPALTGIGICFAKWA